MQNIRDIVPIVDPDAPTGVDITGTWDIEYEMTPALPLLANDVAGVSAVVDVNTQTFTLGETAEEIVAGTYYAATTMTDKLASLNGSFKFVVPDVDSYVDNYEGTMFVFQQPALTLLQMFTMFSSPQPGDNVLAVRINGGSPATLLSLINGVYTLTPITAGNVEIDDVLIVSINSIANTITTKINADAELVTALTPEGVSLSSLPTDLHLKVISLINGTAAVTFTAGLITFDTSNTLSGYVGFEVQGELQLPLNATDDVLYEITTEGTVFGKTGYVGDLAFFTNSLTDIKFIRNIDKADYVSKDELNELLPGSGSDVIVTVDWSTLSNDTITNDNFLQGVIRPLPTADWVGRTTYIELSNFDPGLHGGIPYIRVPFIDGVTFAEGDIIKVSLIVDDLNIVQDYVPFNFDLIASPDGINTNGSKLITGELVTPFTGKQFPVCNKFGKVYEFRWDDTGKNFILLNPDLEDRLVIKQDLKLAVNGHYGDVEYTDLDIDLTTIDADFDTSDMTIVPLDSTHMAVIARRIVADEWRIILFERNLTVVGGWDDITYTQIFNTGDITKVSACNIRPLKNAFSGNVDFHILVTGMDLVADVSTYNIFRWETGDAEWTNVGGSGYFSGNPAVIDKSVCCWMGPHAAENEMAVDDFDVQRVAILESHTVYSAGILKIFSVALSTGVFTVLATESAIEGNLPDGLGNLAYMGRNTIIKVSRSAAPNKLHLSSYIFNGVDDIHSVSDSTEIDLGIQPGADGYDAFVTVLNERTIAVACKTSASAVTEMFIIDVFNNNPFMEYTDDAPDNIICSVRQVIKIPDISARALAALSASDIFFGIKDGTAPTIKQLKLSVNTSKPVGLN